MVPPSRWLLPSTRLALRHSSQHALAAGPVYVRETDSKGPDCAELRRRPEPSRRVISTPRSSPLAVRHVDRVFGIEALAVDRLFCRLTGDSVPSLGTLYRDLGRFDEASLKSLEVVAVKQGSSGIHRCPKSIHVDIDSTPEPMFGRQEGARIGPNLRYKVRSIAMFSASQFASWATAPFGSPVGAANTKRPSQVGMMV